MTGNSKKTEREGKEERKKIGKEEIPKPGLGK